MGGGIYICTVLMYLSQIFSRPRNHTKYGETFTHLPSFRHNPYHNTSYTNNTSLDRQTREKALSSLRTYLTSTHKFTPLELLKIWKALFFCLSPPNKPFTPLAYSFSVFAEQGPNHRRPNFNLKKKFNRHVPHRKPSPSNPPLPDPFLPPPSPTPLPLHSLPARFLHHLRQSIPFPPSTSPRQIPIPHPPLHRHRLHISIPILLAHRIGRCLYRINGKRHRPSLKGQG